MLVLSKKKDNFRVDTQTSLEIVKRVLVLLVLVFAIIYSLMSLSFGIRFILTAITAYVFAREAEMLYLTHHRKMNREQAKEHIVETKPELSGLLLALLLPVNTPVYITLIGIVFGVFIVRMAFGGFSYNIFNVAIAARTFIQVSWASVFTSNGPTSLIDYTLSLIMNVNYSSMNNVLFNGLDFNGFAYADYYFVGIVASLMIVMAFIYLCATKVISPFKTLYALAISFIFFAALGVPQFGLAFITSPVVLLVTIFALNDPITTPDTKVGNLLSITVFVIVSGFMILTKNNQYGIFFGILFMNMIVPLIDGKITKESVKAVIVALILFVGVAYIVNADGIHKQEAPAVDTNTSASQKGGEENTKETDSSSGATGTEQKTEEKTKTDSNSGATGTESKTEEKTETDSNSGASGTEPKVEENTKTEDKTDANGSASPTSAIVSEVPYYEQ